MTNTIATNSVAHRPSPHSVGTIPAVELFSDSFLKISTQYLLQPERDNPMTTELDIQSFIDDVQNDVPSDQRVMAPEGEYAMYIKPGSIKLITDVGDKGR